MKLRKFLSFALAVSMLGVLAACTPKDSVPVEHHPDFPNLDTVGMTDLQKAVVLTAESFVLRKERGQYDDTRLTASGTLAYYRWSTGQRQPEDYTSQHTGYSNCAAFAHDLYLAALDLDIQYYTTASMTLGCTNVLARMPVTSGFASMDESQLEMMKQEILNTLQPGDLIVYRYADNKNGHVMCYVGNHMMIHCTGSSYSYEDQREKYEDIGCFRYESIDSFWEAGHRRYLFDKSSYVIIRPLDSFTGTIPQRTLDRMELMRGVMAEKTASAGWTQTVNPGQELTFTFTLQNLTGVGKTLTLTDTVPRNTKYMSGGDKKEGDTLSWTVTLPARETVQVSYTVQVDDGADVVESSSFVEHIPVNCPSIRVGRTLTSQQQEALAAAAKKADMASKGIALASAIYQEAFDTDVLSGVHANDLLEGVFRYFSAEIESGAPIYGDKWPPQWRALDENGAFAKLVAPGLYGGRNVLEGNSAVPATTLAFMACDRTRLVAAQDLIEGDIVIANDGVDALDGAAWLFVEGGLLDLQTGETVPAEPLLSQLLCRRHFVVIRPSLGM
ncbi:MAG: C40 family peptidase [Oscillospiraceae bacterium]|nr:C40 family peptidase [Oscillospiraceae bacterium]